MRKKCHYVSKEFFSNTKERGEECNLWRNLERENKIYSFLTNFKCQLGWNRI